MNEPKKQQDGHHDPVLPDKVLSYLVSEKAHLKGRVKIIDATLGIGGHSLSMLSSGASVLGIDADNDSLEIARRRIEDQIACPDPRETPGVPCFKAVLGNFRDIDKIAREHGFLGADGILMDLGISSFQLDNFVRGFSFREPNAPLDMRLNQKSQGVTGADILNILNRGELVRMFGEVISDRHKVERLTDAVINSRKKEPIRTIFDFTKLIENLNPASPKKSKILPFLALRIAVNSELVSLTEALPKALSVLGKGGRLAVISFHSGEDRIVKNFFRQRESEGLGISLTKKPIIPSEREMEVNSRSRSAKMRVFEKNSVDINI